MSGVPVGGKRDPARGEDLRRAGDRVPQPHPLAHVPSVRLAGVSMHELRAVAMIDVDGRRVRHERVVLLRRLERRIHAPFRSGEADHPRLGVGRGKRQEEVTVDGDLGALRSQETQRRLSNHLARAARWRHLEADAFRAGIDLRDVHVDGAWRCLTALDHRHADVRRRDPRAGNGGGSRPGRTGELWRGEQERQEHRAEQAPGRGCPPACGFVLAGHGSEAAAPNTRSKLPVKMADWCDSGTPRLTSAVRCWL